LNNHSNNNNNNNNNIWLDTLSTKNKFQNIRTEKTNPQNNNNTAN